jgi:ribonuclease D
VIDTDDKLRELLPRVHDAAWVALDTEADSLHSYPEKLCLIQLTLPAGDYLVDPLADLDLAPLLAALQPHRLILHGSDYDLRLLFRSRRFVPKAIFDTMLAARLLGEMEFGLVNLAAKFLDVQLHKGSQKANWSRRPLTDRMAEYALNDTRHLRRLATMLETALDAKKRLAWHEEMCARLITDSTRETSVDADVVWRLKGSDRLERRAQAILREVWKWREEEAIGANKPPFFIAPHDQLVFWSAAAAQGRPPRELVPERFSSRRGDQLLAAFQRGLAVPASDWPKPRRVFGPRLHPDEKHRFESLTAHRDRQAAELGIDPTLIASRSTLVALAHSWKSVAPQLMSWQRELLGPPPANA